MNVSGSDFVALGGAGMATCEGKIPLSGDLGGLAGDQAAILLFFRARLSLSFRSTSLLSAIRYGPGESEKSVFFFGMSPDRRESIDLLRVELSVLLVSVPREETLLVPKRLREMVSRFSIEGRSRWLEVGVLGVDDVEVLKRYTPYL